VFDHATDAPGAGEPQFGAQGEFKKRIRDAKGIPSVLIDDAEAVIPRIAVTAVATRRLR
jgi:hypothetical protein